MLIPRGKQRAFSAHSCIIRKPFSSGVAADERSGPQCVPAGQVCPRLYRPVLRALYLLCPVPGGAVVGIPGGPLGGLSPGGPAVRTPGPVLRALAVSEQDRVGRTLAALLALAHLPTDCGRGQSLRQGATGAGRGQPPPLCLAQPAALQCGPLPGAASARQAPA